MISYKCSCIEGFFKAWIDIKTSYHFRQAKTHNNLLHSPIFFNLWILRNPTAKDFTEYGTRKPETEYLKPESFGLSNNDCRHKKVIDMLDKRGFKPLSVLKDNPSFAKLNWFSQFRLKTSLEKFSSRNDLTLTLTGVAIPSNKMGKTPLDYVSCTCDSFKRVSKGSSY